MAPKLLSPQNAPVSNISLKCHHTSTLQPSVRVAVTSALRRTYRVSASRGGSQSANERLVVPTVDDLEFYREEGAVSKISDVVGAESMEHFIDAMRAEGAAPTRAETCSRRAYALQGGGGSGGVQW